MKRKWARVFHAIAIAAATGAIASPGTVAAALPAEAVPYLPLAIAAMQMIIGERQHASNPDGESAHQPWNGQ